MVTDHGSFVLINAYFPNGGRGGDRLTFKSEFQKQIQEYCLALRRKENRHVIVVGDVNVAHTELDIYNPEDAELGEHSGFRPEERQWLSDFLNSGFTDSFRERHPDECGHYTWWSPRSGARAENKGWRLDYAFVDKEFDTSDVVDVGILKRVGGSDHCPIMVKLKPQPTLPPHSPPSLSSKRRSRQGKLISFFGRGAGTHGNKQPRVAANVATEERQVCKVETEKKEHQAGDVSGGGGAKEVLTQQAEENIFKAQGSKAVGIPASLEGTTTTAFTKAKPPKQKEHIKKRVSSETLAQTKGQTSMMTFLGKRKER